MKKLLLLYLIVLLPLTAGADNSGTCGDNLTWSYSEGAKKLTISGTGEMWNYQDSYFTDNITTPWSNYTQEMKYVVINNGVTSIGVCAFYGCSNIEKIDIPNSVTKIGRYAFMNCRALLKIDLPYNLVSIGDQAFYGCSSMTSVVIPRNVTSIENDMLFGSCRSLKSIVVEAGNSQYDSRNNCNAIIITRFNKLIQGCNGTIIPDGITEICRTAFCGSAITSITIPNSVTTISYEAFDWCSELTTVVVGNGVTTIGDSFVSLGHSFGSCSKLKDFYIYAINVPSTMENTFDNSNIENATLHVPGNLIDTYKSATPWNRFKEIVALTDSDPKPTDTSENENGEGYDHKMVVSFKNGDVVSFVLKDKPEVTFIGNYFRVKTANNTIDYTRANIADFHFEDDASGVETVEYSGTGDVIIYNISGHVVAKQKNGDQASAKILLDSFKPGMYIIKIGNSQTIKYLKK